MTKQTKTIIMVAVILAVMAGAIIIFRKEKGKPAIPVFGGGSDNDNGSSGENNDSNRTTPDPAKQATWGRVSFPIDYYEKGLEVLHVQGLANKKGADLALDGIHGPNTDAAFKEHLADKPEYYYMNKHKITKAEYDDLIEPYLDSINSYLIKRGKL